MNGNQLRLAALASTAVLTMVACTASPTAVPPEARTVPASGPTSAPATPEVTGVTTGPSTPMSGTVPSTVAPVSADARTVQSNGVSLAYDPSLATDVTGEVVPASTEAMPAYAIAPAHVAFTFKDYPFEYYGPEVQVVPLADYLKQADLPVAVSDQVQELQADIAQRPDLNQKYKVFVPVPEGAPATGAPPLVPPINAQLQMAAKKGYLDFANGSGMRYVYWASQAPLPIDPNSLFYTYQGVTSDGKHFVTATFPVHAPVIAPGPAPSGNMTAAWLNALNPAIAQTIESADPAAFTPPLPTLDALVQSIQVAPNAP
jgi:hypothetical protein